MVPHSNTTLVKVKLIQKIEDLSIFIYIQIQHLLKLNLQAKVEAGQTLEYSNTTLVKVKCKALTKSLMRSVIQIQHLLKLNYIDRCYLSCLFIFKYNTC